MKYFWRRLLGGLIRERVIIREGVFQGGGLLEKRLIREGVFQGGGGLLEETC
jgi:hypothetical protein